MIHFNPITLDDKAFIESYTMACAKSNCDLSFANMYSWQPTFKSAWGVVDGLLVIRFSIDGGEQLGYMPPMRLDGSVDFAHIIPQLAMDANAHGQRLRIVGITDEGLDLLRKTHDGEFSFYSDPAFEDYIYERQSLATLSGKRLQPKRNHINRFLSNNPSYEYRTLTRDQFNDCLTLDCRWRAAHGDECSDMTPERESMLRAFNSYEALGLIGGVLYVDGRIAAFTYGSLVTPNTICTHIEKGDIEIAGCYTMINKLFAEALPPEITLINREEDMGIEGLRRAKLSYYPKFKQEKYTAIYLHEDERECKRLWQSVFGDDDQFVDEFLIHHYDERNMLHISDNEGHYISMVHIIPFECELGRVGYIYGVATDNNHRKEGHASNLMRQAMAKIADEGYDAAVLIPSEEWLRGYYTKFGFLADIQIHTTFSAYNNFDFGSGDDEKNLAMIAPISELSRQILNEVKELHLTKL